MEKMNELATLGENLKSGLDQKVSIVQGAHINPPKATQETEFDKLRKRVSYLCYNKKKAVKQSFVPQNLQIHDKFLNQDEVRRQERKELREKEADHQAGDTDTDSDESIRAIKEAKLKKQAKIDLNKLTDKQI